MEDTIVNIIVAIVIIVILAPFGYYTVNFFWQLCHKDSPMRKEIAENQRRQKELNANLVWWKDKSQESMENSYLIEETDEIESVNEPACYEPSLYECETQAAKDFVKKFNGKMEIDPDFWEKWGLEFRCNLVRSFVDMEFNYEITDRTGKIKKDRDLEIMIKVNFYDAENNLIHVEEEDVDMGLLRQHTLTSYFPLFTDDVIDAERITVYGYRYEW